MLGHKKADSSSKGLLVRIREDSQEPIIVILINYRVKSIEYDFQPQQC